MKKKAFVIIPMAAVLCVAFLAMAAQCRNPQPARQADTLQLELPAASEAEDIIVYEGFTVAYNHTTLVPDWEAYELTAQELVQTYTGKGSQFSRDPNVKGRQSSREDYSHSGWDKGHMVPKADLRWSEKAYWQSHFFTNICPQNHDLNGQDWCNLEKKVRQWARRFGRVYVVCGPIFDSCAHGTIGAAHVAIPDAFFKALLVPCGDSYAAIAFTFANDSSRQPLRSRACTVDQLEALLSRDLFPLLDDAVESTVESHLDLPLWQL